MLDVAVPTVHLPRRGDLVRCGGCGMAFVLQARPPVVCRRCGRAKSWDLPA